MFDLNDAPAKRLRPPHFLARCDSAFNGGPAIDGKSYSRRRWALGPTLPGGEPVVEPASVLVGSGGIGASHATISADLSRVRGCLI